MYSELDARRRAAADQDLRHQPLLPHRGGRPRPGDARHLPRPPVHEGRDVRLHAARGQRRDARQRAAIECKIFDGLGIPYRVIDTASGDLGGPAYRKFDLEAWMPGRGEQAASAARSRAPATAPTISRGGSASASKEGGKGDALRPHAQRHGRRQPRAIIAVIENYQQADGSVTVPEALRQWVGKERIG